MNASGGKPNLDWDDLATSTAFHTLFSYELRGERLVLSLRVGADDSGEVWITAEKDGLTETVSRHQFAKPDDCLTFLHSEERRLKADGWREILVT
jgi:hypothetical protein